MVALKINGIQLVVSASAIDGVSAEKFKEVAEGARSGCIVSKALSVPITLEVHYPA
jgi:osmotically inducible protein OsmC